MNKLNLVKYFAVSAAMLVATPVIADNHMMKDNMKMQKEVMKESNISTYTENAFNKSLAEGKMIVLDFYKDGCPTCAKQHPTLKQASAEYNNADFYRVNFKKDRKTVAKFKVGSQSTIIAFNNGKEVNRTVGETKKVKLMEQIKQASM